MDDTAPTTYAPTRHESQAHEPSAHEHAAQALTTQWTGADADEHARAARYATGGFTRDALSILPSAARFRRQFAQRLVLCAERQRPLAVVALECRVADMPRAAAALAAAAEDAGQGDDAAAARRSAFAMRLVRSFQRGSLLTWVGSDTFIGVLEDLPPQPELGFRIGALVRAIAQPLYVDGMACTPQMRAGIALLPGDGRTGDELCRRARAALARAERDPPGIAWFAGVDD